LIDETVGVIFANLHVVLLWVATILLKIRAKEYYILKLKLSVDELN
jgi:hypothetical protein